MTGSSGFLGRHVARHLSGEAGMEVSGFDLRSDPDARFPVHRGDLADVDAVTRACRGVDVVVHFGGVGDIYVAEAHPDLAWTANVTGTQNVAMAAADAGARLVYASTWEVYGETVADPIDEHHPCNPAHGYAATKLAGEAALRAVHLERDLPVVILRLGTAYGPEMRPNTVFRRFADAARRGEPVVVQGGGHQWRQFTHAFDIARAVRLAVAAGLDDSTLNVVAERCVTVLELATTVAERYGVPVRHAAAREGDPPPARISSAEALRVIGWRAEIDFHEGLSRLLDGLDTRRSS
ncbi:MAG: NAD-dependent epimerase/dehydratase family protein [Candidatus Dormibacteria bacterium]